MIRIIILMNVVIWARWVFGDAVQLDFLTKNFLVSWELLTEGRYWTLLTSVFSHNMVWHLLINMFVLNSFGSILLEVLGIPRFLIFYLVAGIVSSLSHSVVSAFLMNQPELPALGASGAIAGLILVFSLMFPREKILLFALIPMPAMVGALAFIGLDLWGLTEQMHGHGLPIGHGAHLGGAFTGILFYFFYIRSRWLRSPMRRAFEAAEQDAQNVD